jgi:transcriptional regulator with XRE-family HTH domain
MGVIEMKLFNLSSKIKQCGLTQKKLSERLEITEKAVNELVNGKAFPSPRTLEKLLAEFITLEVMTTDGVVISISRKDEENPTPAPADRSRSSGASSKT